MADYSGKTPDNDNRYSREQIEKALLLYSCFKNAELYRYYNNLRYFPKADTNAVVQQTLSELRIVFEMRGLPMPQWRRAKRRKTLWRRIVQLIMNYKL